MKRRPLTREEIEELNLEHNLEEPIKPKRRDLRAGFVHTVLFLFFLFFSLIFKSKTN
jgi:hypothetical protein